MTHCRCLENDAAAAQLQAMRLQWLEQELQHLSDSSSASVDSRLISAAKVLKSQQQDVETFKQQCSSLSQAKSSFVLCAWSCRLQRRVIFDE
jgi:predicted metal-binding membrane protein